MISPQVVADPTTYPALTLSKPHFFLYGLGWFLQGLQRAGRRHAHRQHRWHERADRPHPDKKLGVYVLANADHVELVMHSCTRCSIASVALPVRRSAIGAPTCLPCSRQQEKQAADAQAQALARRVTNTKPSLPTASYAGTYRNVTYGDVVVTASGETLHLKFGNAYEGDLSHWQYETFRARWTNRNGGEGSVTFRPDGAGRIAALQRAGNTFTRVAAPR
jgi:hypothetical protein